MSLLLQFFKNQAKKTRVGVSLFLFDALKEVSLKFSNLKSLSVENVFQDVINSINYKVYLRESSAFSTYKAAYANICFLSGD